MASVIIFWETYKNIENYKIIENSIETIKSTGIYDLNTLSIDIFNIIYKNRQKEPYKLQFYTKFENLRKNETFNILFFDDNNTIKYIE